MVGGGKIREFPHPVVATFSMIMSHYLKRVDMGSVKTCGEKWHEIALEKAGKASQYGREWLRKIKGSSNKG